MQPCVSDTTRDSRTEASLSPHGLQLQATALGGVTAQDAAWVPPGRQHAAPAGTVPPTPNRRGVTGCEELAVWTPSPEATASLLLGLREQPAVHPTNSHITARNTPRTRSALVHSQGNTIVFESVRHLAPPTLASRETHR